MKKKKTRWGCWGALIGWLLMTACGELLALATYNGHSGDMWAGPYFILLCGSPVFAILGLVIGLFIGLVIDWNNESK